MTMSPLKPMDTFLNFWIEQVYKLFDSFFRERPVDRRALYDAAVFKAGEHEQERAQAVKVAEQFWIERALVLF